MTPRHETWTLPSGPLAPGIARSHVAQACHHLPAPTVDVALLLTSELVTNAIRFSDGAVRMVVDTSRDLRVEVQDQAAQEPTVTHPPAMAEHGRGLLIVDALADAWGTQIQGGTKSVWFSLSARQPPTQQPG